MGALGNEAKSTGSGLFGNQASATTTGNTGGGLFGNQTAAATTGSTGGGLFGNKPAGSTGGGLFSGNTGGGATGLFNTSGSANPGTNGSTSGLFSQPKPAGGLFSNTASTQPQGGGMFSANPTIGSQGDQAMMHAKEIEGVLQTYAAQIDPSGTKNEFVACMYNKFGKSSTLQLKDQIKNTLPIKDIANIPENTKVSGEATTTKTVEVFINQRKFARAKKDNPDHDEYYIKQINTYEELFE